MNGCVDGRDEIKSLTCLQPLCDAHSRAQKIDYRNKSSQLQWKLDRGAAQFQATNWELYLICKIMHIRFGIVISVSTMTLSWPLSGREGSSWQPSRLLLQDVAGLLCATPQFVEMGGGRGAVIFAL